MKKLVFKIVGFSLLFGSAAFGQTDTRNCGNFERKGKSDCSRWEVGSDTGAGHFEAR
jgi:hypothetical protein